MLYGTYHTAVPKRVKIARMKEQPPKKPKKPSSIKTAMRIPTDVHAEIHEAAVRADHPMNTEIVQRLRAGAGGATLAMVVEQNEQIMAELKRTQDMIQLIINALGPRR